MSLYNDPCDYVARWLCSAVASRRFDFSRGFQPTVRMQTKSSSRSDDTNRAGVIFNRRDATATITHDVPWVEKPTAKII